MTAAAVIAKANVLSKRDAQQAKLERDLSTWLREALREHLVVSQGPPVEMPKWFQEQIVRGVRVRVIIESL